MSNHVLSPCAVTQAQLASLLSVIMHLDRPRNTEEPEGGPRDGGVSAALDATIIKACGLIDALLDDKARWDASKAGRLEDSILAMHEAQQKQLETQNEPRPCAILRPNLFYSEGLWFAVHGDILENRLAGVGGTPHEALLDFDKNFHNAKPSQIINEK